MPFELAEGYVTFKGDFSKLDQDIIRGQRMADKLNETLNSPVGRQKFAMALDAAKRVNQELEKGKVLAKNYMLGGNTQAQQNRQNRDELWMARQEIKQNRLAERLAAKAQNMRERDENWVAKKEVKEARIAERLKVSAQNRQNRDETWLAKREMREAKIAKETEKAATKKAWGGVAAFGAGATALGAGALALGAGGSPLAQSTLEGSFKLLMTEIGGTFTPLVKDVSKGLQDLRDKLKDMSPEAKSFANEAAKVAGETGIVALALGGLFKVLSWGKGNPLLTGVSIGIGAGSYLNSKLSQSTDAMIGAGQGRNQSLTMKDVYNDKRSQELKSLSPNAAKQAATDDFKKAWDDYEAKRKDYEEYRTGFGGGNIKGGMTRLADTLFFGAMEAKKVSDVTTSQEAFEKAKLRYAATTGANLPARKDAKSSMLWGDAGPVSSMGVADLFKSFQAAGLKGGLAGEQAKTEQQNMLKLMEDSNTVLREIRDKKSGQVPP